MTAMPKSTAEVFAVQDMVWVHSYNTKRAASGKVVRVWARVDGTAMATVDVPGGYFDWDGTKPELKKATIGAKIIVEQYRLKHLVREQDEE